MDLPAKGLVIATGIGQGAGCGENTRASSVCSGTPFSRVVPATAPDWLTIGGFDSYFDGPAVRMSIPPARICVPAQGFRAACVVPSVTRPADQQRDDDGDGQAHARYCRHLIAAALTLALRSDATRGAGLYLAPAETHAPALTCDALALLSDPDGDGIASGFELSIGSDPCDLDSDHDYCMDGIEIWSDPNFGGDRVPLAQDFYDVDGNAVIDMDDSVKILAPSRRAGCSGRRRTDRHIRIRRSRGALRRPTTASTWSMCWRA